MTAVQRVRWPAPVAGVLSAAVATGALIAYVLLIRAQGIPSEVPRARFVALFLAVMAVMTITGSIATVIDRKRAQPMLYAAAAGFLVSGIFALASVGWGLILAGILAFIAAGRPLTSRLVIVVAAAAPVAVLLGEFLLTN